MSKKKATSKAHRKGMTLLEVAEKFPTEEAAKEWFAIMPPAKVDVMQVA